jgi:hypothetical protein
MRKPRDFYTQVPAAEFVRGNIHDLGAALALSGCTRESYKLSYKDQRRILDFPVFGKLSVYYDGMNHVRVYRQCAFGADVTSGRFSLLQVIQAAHEKTPLSDWL